MNLYQKIKQVILTTLVMGAFSVLATVPAHAYNAGDIFAGVGNGQIYRYDQTGTLLQVLNTTSGSSEQTGMCFDAPGNLYSTNFTANNMAKFDNVGTLTTFPWGGPFSTHPESCVVDGAGNVYTGEVDGSNDIRKWDSAGNPLGSFSPATGPRGVDWLDLSADQCTMLYTSEGSAVKRFDVCTNTQLSDFATGLVAPCFALRIRSNGEVMVTCRTQTYRLDPTGAVLQTYPIGGETLFAMNLDPDGQHFWTGGYTSRSIYKVNIATGAGTGAPAFTAAVVGPSLAGLALFGEPTVAQPDITLDPPTAVNETGTNHTVTATIKAGGNPVPGELVSFSVTAGPNMGQVSDPGECTTDPNCMTDANGQTSWTYTSNGVPGVDTIEACFADKQGQKHCAKATKEWREPPNLPGRMTGGGTIGDTTAKHGFELHCNVADLPNRLEVNWGKGNKFHLEALTKALCSDDPSIDPTPPFAGFDTYKGEGLGRYNGVSGYTAKWTFTDAGEPGVNDYATISIVDPLNVPVATFTGNLEHGNQQAHNE